MEGLLFNRSADLDVCAEQYMNIYLDAHKNSVLPRITAEILGNFYGQVFNRIDHCKVKISEDLSCDAGEYGNYKYIYPILKVLYENGAVSVGKLAECLKIELF